MSLLTCKDFLNELNAFLDDESQAEIRTEIENHLNECPNCWVVCDTTKKTIEIYKGLELYPIPSQVHSRLMDALQKKIAAKAAVS